MSKEPLEEYRYKEKLSLKDLKSHEEGVHKITCPSCATDVSAANLNIQTNIAKCTSCNGIFSFRNHVEKLSLQNKISQEILQPEGVEINRFRDELDFGVFMIFNSNKGQKHIELLKFVSNRSKAKYIEQEIENHLGIPDRRVPDEVV